MGGTHSLPLSRLAVEKWEWYIERKFTKYLPGVENIQADRLSQHVTDSSNWRLNWEVFLGLEERLGPFSIDRFASRRNAQLQVYCSWKPNPAAVTVDTLSTPWKNLRAYMFPPFALITRCQEERASATMVAPVCPNQTWFPRILDSQSCLPILLPSLPHIFTSPEGHLHPLATRADYLWLPGLCQATL